MSNRRFKPSCEVVCHTKAPCGKELITMKGSFHRFILSEFNTHRAFSRNSASSRAVPIAKMLELACHSNVEPLEWGKNDSGMSAKELLEGEQKGIAKKSWARAKWAAITNARSLMNCGAHKQIVNRLLEPFLPHTVIFTTDEKGLNHFFKLRLSPDAQPEIRAFANAVFTAFGNSKPVELNPGEMHLPFVEGRWHWTQCIDSVLEMSLDDSEILDSHYSFSTEIMQSVATCARVSYLAHEKEQTKESQEKLFDSLLSNGHLSPFEHIAVAGDVDFNSTQTLFTKILCLVGFSGLYSMALKQNYSLQYLQFRKIVEN